jgi:murein L,D-transpeptidase YcbB/YkuD
MKKLSVIAVASLVLFGTSLSALAAQETIRRKPNFFERLFGVQPRAARPRQREWWENKTPSVRVIRGSEKKKAKPVAPRKVAVAIVDIDPEVAAGFGMGNIAYVPVAQVAVFDGAFAKLTSADVEPSALRVVLADKRNGIEALPEVRKAVLDHYKATGFKPLWTENGNVNARGLAVLNLLAKAGDEGLDALRYKPSAIKSFENATAQLDGDGLGLAQFDVELSVAALTFALHHSGGAFEPERLSNYHDIKPERVSAAGTLRVLAYSPFPVEYLNGLAPKHPAFAALKAELARIAAPVVPSNEIFAEGKRIRIGQK